MFFFLTSSQFTNRSIADWLPTHPNYMVRHNWKVAFLQNDSFWKGMFAPAVLPKQALETTSYSNYNNVLFFHYRMAAFVSCC